MAVSIVRFWGATCLVTLIGNGEVLHCETLSERMRPSLVFPRLPEDEQELNAGWEAHDGRDDGTIRYTLLGGKKTKDRVTFDFHAVWDTYAEKIYEQEDNHDFHFDREKASRRSSSSISRGRSPTCMSATRGDCTRT